MLSAKPISERSMHSTSESGPGCIVLIALLWWNQQAIRCQTIDFLLSSNALIIVAPCRGRVLAQCRVHQPFWRALGASPCACSWSVDLADDLSASSLECHYLAQQQSIGSIVKGVLLSPQR